MAFGQGTDTGRGPDRADEVPTNPAVKAALSVLPIGVPALALVWGYAAGDVSAGAALALAAALMAASVYYGFRAWRGAEIPDPYPVRLMPSTVADKIEGTGENRPGVSAADILEHIPDPLVVLDGRSRILVANGASRGMFRSIAVGRPLASVIRIPTVFEAVERVLRGAPAQTVEYTVLVPYDRYLRAYVAPLDVERIPSEPGVPAVLILMTDLTAIKRMEQMRADFVANASHELRTPLASLTGFIETLRGHAKDDDAARERFLQIMSEQTDRMGRLINDLMSLSRIELNEHVPPAGVVDLRRVIDDVLDAMSPLARQEDIDFKIIGEPPGPVTGEQDQLVQVFQNLIHNAIKYGSSGKRIEIEFGSGHSNAPGAPASPMAFVAVRDFGIGVAREHIPRLTERFYRVDVEQSRKSGGTGLGLAIAKHIVIRHRGWLQIVSVEGEGSTFKVFLPEADDRKKKESSDPVVTLNLEVGNAPPPSGHG